jgi:quercetin dioxygenase-like cupin family protein
MAPVRPLLAGEEPMHKTRTALVWLAIAGAIAASAVGFAQSNLATLIALTPGEMKFVADPERPGLASSVLVGDPSRPGIYAVHTRLPANFRIEPHSHAEAWRVATVLSGTLYYGYGDTFDEKKLRVLGPGSVLVEPKGAPHFALTKDQEVMLHIVAEGPASTDPVRR